MQGLGLSVCVLRLQLQQGGSLRAEDVGLKAASSFAAARNTLERSQRFRSIPGYGGTCGRHVPPETQLAFGRKVDLFAGTRTLRQTLLSGAP